MKMGIQSMVTLTAKNITIYSYAKIKFYQII